MAALTIGKFAEAGGVGVETVRYYQRRGLLHTPERPVGAGLGSVRCYSEEEVRRLKFIRAAQAAGFTLEQIQELLSLDASDDRPRARTLASARIRALDQKIAELTAAREALARLAQSCASGLGGPCPILKAFDPD